MPPADLSYLQTVLMELENLDNLFSAESTLSNDVA